jgi:inner membrane protein
MNFEFSPWLIWFVAGVAVMLTELTVPGFVIVFFGLGCWGAAVVAAIAPDAHSAQLAVFLIVSLASLVTLRKMAMRIFVGRSKGPESEDTGNVPMGARIYLDQDLEPGLTGRVRFRGTMWDPKLKSSGWTGPKEPASGSKVCRVLDKAVGPPARFAATFGGGKGSISDSMFCSLLVETAMAVFAPIPVIQVQKEDF